MVGEARIQSQRMLSWLIRRNPLYLVSACLTAVGARLFLVDPSDAAGDVALILVTLVVLQVYEWAVNSVLIVLFRAGRSPEDRPSILLVAAAFWTGPLAATLEMIAYQPRFGTPLAIAAGLIALGELRFIIKIIQLPLTVTTQVIAAACIVLVAAAAPLLKMPESGSGLNEIYLYAAWWVFAVAVLGCFNLARRIHLGSVAQNATRIGLASKYDAIFLAITLIASLVHLIGLNYAFFCHASAFYASPLVVAASVVGMAALARSAVCYRPLLVFLALLPAIAVGLALERFDAEVPVQLLPVWLRDPAVGIALIASAAWWFGYWRHRANALLHAGSAAFAFAVLRHVDRSIISPVDVHPVLTILALYAMTAYLLILAWLLSSRREAIVALVAHLAATILLVVGKTPADSLIICLVAGWSGLACVHLAVRRPRLLLRLLPILFLALAPWALRSADIFKLEIAGHAIGMALVLLVVGRIWQWTRYISVSLALLAAYAAGGGAYFAAMGEHAAATILTFAGFSVLVAGALLSWHKQQLLSLTAVPTQEAPDSIPSTEATTT